MASNHPGPLQPAPPRDKKRKHPSKTSKPRKKKTIECPICLDPVKPSQLLTLPSCTCQYCKSCLSELLTLALFPIPHSFPARCCNRPLAIHDPSLEKHIPASLRRRYDLKAEEAASSNPAYCANEGCKVFIPHSGYDKDPESTFATCGVCHRKTCLREGCKRLKGEHFGVWAICPDVVEDGMMQQVCDEEQWKRCPKCWCVVERVRGCDSIRCRCKAEWCYKCGKLTRGAPKTIEMRIEDGVEPGDEKYEGLCMCHAKVHVNLVEDGDELPELSELLNLGDTSRSRMRSEGRLLEGVSEVATEVIEID